MHLILFFTKEMSLVEWDNTDIFSREILLYTQLIAKGFQISIITYDNSDDLKCSDSLSEIKILCNAGGLPKYIYNKYLHIIHRKHLKSCNIIKTTDKNRIHIWLNDEWEIKYKGFWEIFEKNYYCIEKKKSNLFRSQDRSRSKSTPELGYKCNWH